jgi:hypothetical protein
MTTNNAAAARTTDKRIALAALFTLLGFGMAGCETSNTLFGSSQTAAPVAPPAAAAPAATSAKIAIAPVIGAPEAVANQMATQVGAAIEKQRITLAKSPTEKADYTLRGYVVAAREKAGTKVSYIWDVTDPAGKRVNRITGEEVVASATAKDPWAAVTPQMTQAIAEKTASTLGAWLPSQSQAAVAGGATPAGVGAAAAQPTATTAAAAPGGEAARAPQVASAPPATSATTGSIGREGALTAIVPSVTGAPGDGATSLTGALQRELTRNGVGLASKPTPTAYRVEGRVKVSEAKEGKQAIQIDWDVKDGQGKKLGTVSQKNEVPEGSLNGAWGQTADAAAAAAAQGILKLMPQAKATN